eukprot:1861728-Alexandrium_andersonii.AAC.1
MAREQNSIRRQNGTRARMFRSLSDHADSRTSDSLLSWLRQQMPGQHHAIQTQVASAPSRLAQ